VSKPNKDLIETRHSEELIKFLLQEAKKGDKPCSYRLLELYIEAIDHKEIPNPILCKFVADKLRLITHDSNDARKAFPRKSSRGRPNKKVRDLELATKIVRYVRSGNAPSIEQACERLACELGIDFEILKDAYKENHEYAKKFVKEHG